MKKNKMMILLWLFLFFSSCCVCMNSDFIEIPIEIEKNSVFSQGVIANGRLRLSCSEHEVRGHDGPISHCGLEDVQSRIAWLKKEHDLPYVFGLLKTRKESGIEEYHCCAIGEVDEYDVNPANLCTPESIRYVLYDADERAARVLKNKGDLFLLKKYKKYLQGERPLKALHQCLAFWFKNKNSERAKYYGLKNETNLFTPDLTWDLGMRFWQKEQLADAQECFESQLESKRWAERSEKMLWKMAGLYIKQQEYNKAINVLAKIAPYGNGAAEYALANIYHAGQGVERDDDMVFSLMMQSFNKGYSKAAVGVGLCLKEGIGVARNKEYATRWYHYAFNKGHTDAGYTLALLYRELGNSKQSDACMLHCAKQGYAQALEFLGHRYLCECVK